MIHQRPRNIMHTNRKRALSASGDLENTTTKRLHHSIICIGTETRAMAATQGSIITISRENGDSITHLNTSHNSSTFSEEPATTETATQAAIMTIGENENHPPQMVSVPLQILTEILDEVKSIKQENKDLKQAMVDLKLEVRNIGSKRDPPNTTRTTGHATNQGTSANTQRQTPQAQPNSGNINIQHLKEKIVPNWGKKYHYRRNQYRNCDKNLKQAAVFSGFLDNENKYIPKKYRPKFSRDEYDYKLSEKNSIQEMTTQKERWKYYADLSKNNVQSVDQQVNHAISQHPIKQERDILTKKWKDEVATAEKKAEDLNVKELKHMCDLPTSDPYSGFVAASREPQQNGGFYKRNYYRSTYTNRSHQNRSQQRGPF